MQSIFSTALSRAVAKHIGLSTTRRETLSWLALLIMQHGTISLWRLAAYVVSAAQTASVQRRFYRFFQFVRLDGTHSARVVVELLGLSGKPWVLAIDRTNWDFGKTAINILMISVAWNGMGIPLLWMLLPMAGNSNTSERTELLNRLRTAFPEHEDCGPDGRSRVHWRCVDGLSAAQKDPIYPASARKPVCPARGLCSFTDLRHRTASQGRRKNDRQRQLPTRPCERDFVRVGAAGDNAARVRRAVGAGLFRQGASCARALSRTLDDRNDVRQSQTKGFALETIHLTNPDKLCTLLALLAFAVALSVKTGVARTRLHAIPTKKHGRRAWSLFALGVNTPPPKGGGFRLRLKAGSVRPAADSGNGKIVVRLRRRLVLDVFRPDLIGDVAAARNPISPRPQVLAPVALAQYPELAQQFVRTPPLQMLYHTRHRQARRDRYKQMNVVAIDRAGVNHHLMCPRRLPQKFPALLSHVATQHLVSVLRHPHQVVFSVPDRMAAALVRLHLRSLHRKCRNPSRLKAWGFLIPYRGL